MKFELTPDNRGVADEVLLEDLRCIARLLAAESLPREEYDRRGRFHPKTLVKRFGSWNRALQLAGLRVRKPNNLSMKECLADLRRVAETLGATVVTVEQYRRFGTFTEGPFRRLFGTWADALQQAGLEVSGSYHERYSEEELFQNLEAVWRAVGRQPKRSDMREPLSAIGSDSYRRRFGSWRKALEAFVAYVNHTPVQEATSLVNNVEENGAGCQPRPAVSGPVSKTSRSISWRLRFLVMRRDAFKCRFCGVSPAVTPGTILVVDHVVPWSKGGETLLSNLQTLCEVCNGGKSDLSQ